MSSKKELISLNLETVTTEISETPFSKLQDREFSLHANTARHLAGLPQGFTRKEMEKSATFLLSINYLKTQPRDKTAIKRAA